MRLSEFESIRNLKTYIPALCEKELCNVGIEGVSEKYSDLITGKGTKNKDQELAAVAQTPESISLDSASLRLSTFPI